MTMMATQEPTDPSVLLNSHSNNNNATNSTSNNSMNSDMVATTTGASSTATTTNGTSNSHTFLKENTTGLVDTDHHHSSSSNSPSPHVFPTCRSSSMSSGSSSVNQPPPTTPSTTTTTTTTTTTNMNATRTPPRSSLASDPNLTPIASIKRPRANLIKSHSTTCSSMVGGTGNGNTTSSYTNSSSSANRSSRTPQQQQQPMLMSPTTNSTTSPPPPQGQMTSSTRYTAMVDDATPLSPMHKIKPVLHRDTVVVKTSTTMTEQPNESCDASTAPPPQGVIQDKVEELFSPVVQFLHDHESLHNDDDHHHHPRVTNSTSDDVSLELDFDAVHNNNSNHHHHHHSPHYNTDDDEVHADDEDDEDDVSMSRPEAPDYNNNNPEGEFNPWQFIASLPPYESVVVHRPPITLPPLVEYPSSTSPPQLRKKTLVLDLDETLVHCSVTEPADQIVDFTFPVQFHGETYSVHVKCRPYLQQFLNEMCQHFEVVVFTASQKVYADALLNILDPNGKLIHHRLFRESCLAVEGNYLKDLNVLGRDLRRTVLVDNSPHAFGYQVSNGIPIESWFDCPNDRELIKLQRFLLSQVLPAEDVRVPVRNKFQSHILIATAPPLTS